MSVVAATPGRLGIADAIARRESKAFLRGLGGYFAVTAALAAATWMLLIDLRDVEEAGILVRAEPFGAPLVVAMLVLLLFLAVSASVSVVRDRESGTLEVLFYGPVDEVSYVLGKVSAHLFAFLAALPLLAAGLLLLSLMTGFRLTPTIYAGIALSVVPAAEIVSFGILVSVCASRVRTAVLVLIAVTTFLVGTTLAYEMVIMVPVEDASSPVIPLRDALAMLNGIVVRISPFAHLERIIDAVASGSWRRAGVNLAMALALSAGFLALAILWLRRRGVQGTGSD